MGNKILTSRETIEELMNKAEFHADESLHCGSDARPTLYLHCQNGTTTGYYLDKGIKDHATLCASIHQMCVAHNADAAVLCVEAWINRDISRPGQKHPVWFKEPLEHEEAVVLVGTSRDENFQRVLPILRMDDGSYFRFADGINLQNQALAGEFGTFLSESIPCQEMQRAAKASLEANGLFPINGKRRGRGREPSWF